MTAAQTTIVALSTAPAPSGVAVVRISGPDCLEYCNAIFSSRKKLATNPRQMIYGICSNPVDKSKLDSCMAVYMPGPNSFTGEDVCELHLHGSPILVKEVLGCLYAAGATPAEAGEFTKRAFLNDKLDLIQAEAIGDIIEATSTEGLKIAQEQLSGRLSGVVNEVGEPLKDILAELEAGIDFPEEDIQPDSIAKMQTALDNVKFKIQSLIESYEYGHIVRDGFRVLLFGRPNVGKSSLLNYLLDTDRAIVTDISGTTRDILEEKALINGIQFVFCDTAGITDSDDTVEQIGIKRAQERLSWADLVLFVIDAQNPDPSALEELKNVRKTATAWPIINKIDLNSKFNLEDNVSHYVSVASREGCSELKAKLVSHVQSQAVDSAATTGIVTNERHRNCLMKASDGLTLTSEAINQKQPAELISIELRSALSALEELVGRTETEDILGRIFSKFCIGK